MINPLKRERLAWGLTQDQLAKIAGVTHDNVVRNEQGLFNSPSPKLLSAICSYSNLDSQQILLEYTNWIAWRRRSGPAKNLMQRYIRFRTAEELFEHPFKLWREVVFKDFSRIAFCQILCVHPATVLKYESGKQKPMPSQIKTALLECGLSPEKVRYLAQLGEEYYKVQRARNAT